MALIFPASPTLNQTYTNIQETFLIKKFLINQSLGRIIIKDNYPSFLKSFSGKLKYA